MSLVHSVGHDMHESGGTGLFQDDLLTAKLPARLEETNKRYER
jgi:hypothetical protein